MTCLSRCLKLAATCVTWMAPPKNLLRLPGFLPMWLKHTRIETLDSLAMQIAQQAQHSKLANCPSRACPRRCGSRWCSDCRPLSHHTDRWSADVAAAAVLHFTMTCMSNEALNNRTRMHGIHHWKTSVLCIDCFVPPLRILLWYSLSLLLHKITLNHTARFLSHISSVLCGPLCASYKEYFSDLWLHLWKHGTACKIPIPILGISSLIRCSTFYDPIRCSPVMRDSHWQHYTFHRLDLLNYCCSRTIIFDTLMRGVDRLHLCTRVEL